MDTETSIGIATVVGFLLKEIASGALKETGKEYLFKPIVNLLTPAELTTLNLFGDVPDSPKLTEQTTNILETHLTNNPQVADELAELIKQLPKAETTNINFQSGESNINIQGNQNSQIKFNK